MVSIIKRLGNDRGHLYNKPMLTVRWKLRSPALKSACTVYNQRKDIFLKFMDEL